MNSNNVKAFPAPQTLLKLIATSGLLVSAFIFTPAVSAADESNSEEKNVSLSDNNKVPEQSKQSPDKEKKNRGSLGAGVGKTNIAMDRSLTGFENVNESLSLWELGVGGGAFYNPKYPASSEGRFFSLALPFVVYRGETFRIGDGGGARAVVIENENFEIDFSFGVALPSDSEDNSARVGMPELDFLGEIGPQMIFMLGNYDFDKNADGENIGTNLGKGRLDLRLQARAVFSTDFSRIDGQGYIFEPQISYQHRGLKHQDTAFNISFGMIFATEETHDYFYEVSPEFATADRPAYDAKAGYLGSELSLGLSFKVSENVRGFVGGSAQFHSLAANKDSPLFDKEVTYSIGTAFVWRFYKSEALAKW